MNTINISRLGMSRLPLKLHNLSSNTFWRKNQFLLCCGYYFEPLANKKCYSSQISRTPGAVLFSDRSRHLESLFLRDFENSHQLASFWSFSFTQWRNFTNDRQRETDGKSQDKVVSKSREDGEVEASLKKDEAVNEEASSGTEVVKKLTLYQRFKKTYKEHGKILVAVHLVTSAVWFGSFYTVARCGVDVVPIMESLNFSERFISPFRSGSLGNVAVAYLMYKLATPARYTVTIGGTNLAIKYLRREGKIPHVSNENTIRSLYKEGKDNFQRRSRVHFKRLQRKHKSKLRVTHTREKH